MKINFDSEGTFEGEAIPVRQILEKLTLQEKKSAVGICLNDTTLLDLEMIPNVGGEAKVLYLQDDTTEVRFFYRHSMSHVLAQAVKRLYPKAKLAIGPAIKDGFYYDFDVEKPFTPEDLEKISKEMDKIISEKHQFKRKSLSAEEASQIIEKSDEPYKAEILNDIKGRGESISFYEDGDFVDLCAGPHIPTTGYVKNFKLLEVAGAYWKGREDNKMLQRIYGTAFYNKKDLKDYLEKIEEAKKRDHRRLGKDLDLFSTKPDTVGGGLILWHPKGGLIRHLIEDHCKKRHLASGYDFVYSPHIGRATLWETSGHLEFYKDGMYAPIDIEGQEYYLKPMNCPFHVQIFGSQLRSYRDLPLRFAEWGTVYRFERSGTLHGLTRVRGFTQDDAHLFCRVDQMPEEIDRVLEFSLGMLRDFGFKDFNIKLSTRPEKRVGEEERWDASENALKSALERSGVPYEVNPGDGAFYGPKIDICVTDALERLWQLSTIQFDFNLPERFDISYIGEDGKQHRPYMLHRALLGSMERFFGVLIEHYGGAFPTWLSPEQVRILPIAERHQEFAASILEVAKEKELRFGIDQSSNTLGYRVREAQAQKIPFVFVVGDKEVESRKVSIRKRGGEDLGSLDLDNAFDLVNESIKNRT